jgi:hypothetical protein
MHKVWAVLQDLSSAHPVAKLKNIFLLVFLSNRSDLPAGLQTTTPPLPLPGPPDGEEERALDLANSTSILPVQLVQQPAGREDCVVPQNLMRQVFVDQPASLLRVVIAITCSSCLCSFSFCCHCCCFQYCYCYSGLQSACEFFFVVV